MKLTIQMALAVELAFGAPVFAQLPADEFATRLVDAAMVLGESPNAEDYRPGDLVTWMLPRNLPHIGIVVNRRSSDGRRPLVVHNIGAGPELDDVLFEFPITGHYRYDGSR